MKVCATFGGALLFSKQSRGLCLFVVFVIDFTIETAPRVGLKHCSEMQDHEHLENKQVLGQLCSDLSASSLSQFTANKTQYAEWGAFYLKHARRLIETL